MVAWLVLPPASVMAGDRALEQQRLRRQNFGRQ
jgi:hypothetical protein